MTQRTKTYRAVLALACMMGTGVFALPAHADPTTPPTSPDKGKPGKGKGDGGDTIPIKVEPPIITKDPKSPPPPPPKKKNS